MTFQQIADAMGEGRRTVEHIYYTAMPKVEMALIRRGIRLEDLLQVETRQVRYFNVSEPE